MLKTSKNELIIFGRRIVKMRFTIVHSSLWSLSDKLLTSFDNAVDKNLKLSIKFGLYVLVLQVSSSFLIGTEKVTYFYVFSPKHSNWPSDFFVSLFIIKW